MSYWTIDRSRKVFVHKTHVVIGLLLLQFMAGRCFAEPLAVLYPQLREPYKQLFDAIIEGVRDNYVGEVIVREVGKDEADGLVAAWVNEQRATAVLALGGRGAAVLSHLPADFPAVVGAVMSSPVTTKWPGISLNPDPQFLFDRLLQLQPSVKNIYVVVPQGADAGVLQQARTAAASRHLALVEQPVKGVLEMAQQYRLVLNAMDRRRDALWVAHDGKLLDSSLMEQLLETAWQRELLVFSSSLVDVKRGALFTLYPDNRAMGKELAQLVAEVQRQSNNAPAELKPVRTLMGAINLRTADHLSLAVSPATRQQFTLTFPEGSR
jgi:putative ABC transport system substrate-binding protein